jgi:hypothetical protein
LLSFVALAAGTLAYSQPVIAQVDASKEICKGVGIVGGGGGCGNEAKTQTKVNDTIKLAVNVLTMIVGVIALIMIIVGGLKYITSGGDATQTAGAKNTIMYAVIGLVVVALAQIIVRFVLTKIPA